MQSIKSSIFSMISIILGSSELIIILNWQWYWDNSPSQIRQNQVLISHPLLFNIFPDYATSCLLSSPALAHWIDFVLFGHYQFQYWLTVNWRWSYISYLQIFSYKEIRLDCPLSYFLSPRGIEILHGVIYRYVQHITRIITWLVLCYVLLSGTDQFYL